MSMSSMYPEEEKAMRPVQRTADAIRDLYARRYGRLLDQRTDRTISPPYPVFTMADAQCYGYCDALVLLQAQLRRLQAEDAAQE